MAATAATQGVGAPILSGDSIVIRAAAALTTSFVESTYYADVGSANKVVLLVDKTWADSTSNSWYLEWSNDAAVWRRELGTAYSAGVNTVVPLETLRTAGASEGVVESHNVIGRYVKAWFKKTGGTGADSLTATIQLMKTI